MSEDHFPRLEIDLDKVFHNAAQLVARLGERGISVTGVTKATLGMPEIAKSWIRAGVCGLGDSRVENMHEMQSAGVDLPMSLIRTPMISQVPQVVRIVSTSFNTEIQVLRRLSVEAKKADCMHKVLLMVELGDLREGIMPDLLEGIVRDTLCLEHITFTGIGTNLACRSGVSPGNDNMGQLSTLADSLDAKFGFVMKTVSGGNSANLEWALDSTRLGRVNNLRLGESMLLGCEPLHRQVIEGLYTDAFTLIAEVIELNRKPSEPWGNLAQSAFGEEKVAQNQGEITQAILAIGRQDIDHEGLIPPKGIEILSASSDHLVVQITKGHGSIQVGHLMSFQLNYSALLRAMTSPFIEKVTRSNSPS